MDMNFGEVFAAIDNGQNFACEPCALKKKIKLHSDKVQTWEVGSNGWLAPISCKYCHRSIPVVCDGMETAAKATTVDQVRARLERLKKGGPLTAQTKDELVRDAAALADRVEKALAILMTYSQIDGAHHKTWTLDQTVRALLACPLVTQTAKDAEGKSYSYETMGESAEYKKFIKDFSTDEEGNEYSWDTGIAP